MIAKNMMSAPAMLAFMPRAAPAMIEWIDSTRANIYGVAHLCMRSLQKVRAWRSINSNMTKTITQISGAIG